MLNKPCIQTFALLSALTIPSIPVEAKVKADFNGDGKADLIVRNVFSGALTGWLTNGTSIISTPSYGTVAPKTGKVIIGIKDANGDGRSDLYWYNFNTGAVSTWLIDGGTVSSKVSYGRLNRRQGWSPIGLADFNADGKTDFFWYNAYTGEVNVWFIDGSKVLSKISYGKLPPSDGWNPIGIKDLNGDKSADLLIYNAYTGDVGAWLINGDYLSSTVYGVVDPNQGWRLIGLEDFNGDGKYDVLGYNIYTGNISALLIDGDTILQEVGYGTLNPNTGWTLRGFSDFNGDNNTDFLWYNVYTGGTGAWLISGSNGSQSISYGTLAPKGGWTPMGLDDFNGDDNGDLLWYNAYTYATTTWLLNGNGISQSAAYGSVPSASLWQINIPR
ncbi:MAG: FG-GAP repeat domain-containing protein [Methylococcales bacterium]